MSYSTFYRVYKTKVAPVGELRNSWGTAPVIWDYLCRRYLHTDGAAWMFNEETRRRLWNLTDDVSVPLSLRLALAFTLDYTFCPTEKAGDLAHRFDEAAGIVEDGKRVNHWHVLAKALRETKPRARQMGFSLGCTSVSDPWEDYAGGEVRDVFALVSQ